MSKNVYTSWVYIQPIGQLKLWWLLKHREPFGNGCCPELPEFLTQTSATLPPAGGLSVTLQPKINAWASREPQTLPPELKLGFFLVSANAIGIIKYSQHHFCD